MLGKCRSVLKQVETNTYTGFPLVPVCVGLDDELDVEVVFEVVVCAVELRGVVVGAAPEPVDIYSKS
jgi:hypothetical protein